MTKKPKVNGEWMWSIARETKIKWTYSYAPIVRDCKKCGNSVNLSGILRECDECCTPFNEILMEEIRHWEKALEVNPNSPIAWNNFGVAKLLLEEEKPNDEIYEPFLKALDFLPTYEEALINLVYAAYCLGNYENMKKYLKKIIEINPFDPRHWVILAGIYYRERNYKKKQESLQKAYSTLEDFDIIEKFIQEVATPGSLALGNILLFFFRPYKY